MTKLNWQKAAAEDRYRRLPHDRIARSSTPKGISNSQKKLISTMLKERGMVWVTEINSLSREEASQFIRELKCMN